MRWWQHTATGVNTHQHTKGIGMQSTSSILPQYSNTRRVAQLCLPNAIRKPYCIRWRKQHPSPVSISAKKAEREGERKSIADWCASWRMRCPSGAQSETAALAGSKIDYKIACWIRNKVSNKESGLHSSSSSTSISLARHAKPHIAKRAWNGECDKILQHLVPCVRGINRWSKM